MPTITRLYSHYEDAARTVGDLEAAGLDAADLSIVANRREDAAEPADDPDVTPAAVAAGTGEAIGALIGGGAGLLAGLGVLAIPGLGLVVAAGWLVAAVTGAGAGAAAGSLLGALVGTGLSEEHAHRHIEEIRRGGALVTAKVGDAKSAVATRIMDARAVARNTDRTGV